MQAGVEERSGVWRGGGLYKPSVQDTGSATPHSQSRDTPQRPSPLRPKPRHPPSLAADPSVGAWLTFDDKKSATEWAGRSAANGAVRMQATMTADADELTERCEGDDTTKVPNRRTTR
jgi:hypothetical protein